MQATSEMFLLHRARWVRWSGPGAVFSFMAKLSTLRPTLGALPGRLAPMKKIVDPFYVSPEWRSLVAKIKNERGDRCQDCGSTHRVAGDHVIEIKDGGAKLDPGNVRLRCAACHNRKTIEARKARQRGGG